MFARSRGRRAATSTPTTTWRSGNRTVFAVEGAFLVALLAMAVVYRQWDGLRGAFPPMIGPVSIGVPWFGALGAVIISLAGGIDHTKDWDPSWAPWHYSRPFVGAALGVVAALIFKAGVLATGSSVSNASAPNDLLYYLIAFVVGYREETFRTLIKRLIDVLLSPGDTPKPPTISTLTPSTGPAAGAGEVGLIGHGFTGATAVHFGSAATAGFTFVSDTEMRVTVPKGVPGTVGVTVTSAGVTSGGLSYTYTPDAA